jgi:hypothetical protein
LGSWRSQYVTSGIEHAINLRIEDTQAVVVHTALVEDARSALELLGPVDTAQEDIVPDAQGLAVVLEEEGLVVAEAAHRHFFHLLGVLEVHAEILDYSIAQSHVPQPVDIVDAERATLRSQPC